MFESKDFEDKFEDIFTDHDNTFDDMDGKIIGYICAGLLIVLLVLICCCRKRRSRGQVLSPAPTTVVTTQAPYPQQQYATYPVPGPVAYPAPQNSYPSFSPAPTVPPVPPGPSNPPYPTSSYPYQAPYIQQPQMYPTAPSAPEANALPPPYEQACAKPPPHNPNAPY
ncbi:nematocyst expressed protein 4-like [Danaus plexippus]|nr:nematocyst expressed protein 4-like [Danaus plexippus]